MLIYEKSMFKIDNNIFYIILDVYLRCFRLLEMYSIKSIFNCFWNNINFYIKSKGSHFKFSIIYASTNRISL